MGNFCFTFFKANSHHLSEYREIQQNPLAYGIGANGDVLTFGVADELEKLAKMKNESLQRLQHLNLYPVNPVKDNYQTEGSVADSTHSTRSASSQRATQNTTNNPPTTGKYIESIISPEISQILAKYSSNEQAAQPPQQRFSNSIHEIHELDEASFTTFNPDVHEHFVAGQNTQQLQQQQQQQPIYISTIPFSNAVTSPTNTNFQHQPQQQAPQVRTILTENQNTNNNPNNELSAQSTIKQTPKGYYSREHSPHSEFPSESVRSSNQKYKPEVSAYSYSQQSTAMKPQTPSQKERFITNSQANSTHKVLDGATNAIADPTEWKRQFRDENTQVGVFDKENLFGNPNIPTPLSCRSARNQTDFSKSTAFSNAMKALQDQVVQAETENKKIKKQAEEEMANLKNENQELAQKLREHQFMLKNKENDIKELSTRYHDESVRLREENASIRAEQKSLEDQIIQLKADINKLKDDKKQTENECSILKREIELVQIEKERHLEENLNEKEQYEHKIREITYKSNGYQATIEQLERELKEALECKETVEWRLNGLISESAAQEKQDQTTIFELQVKLEEALKKIISLEDQSNSYRSKSEREKSGYLSKLQEIEKEYEERLKVSTCYMSLWANIRIGS